MITLHNLQEHSVPLSKGWLFTDENNNLSPEHNDQIFQLSDDAAKFLWEFEILSSIESTNMYFNKIEVYNCTKDNPKTIKKFLYNLGIPFDQKVFMAIQPTLGFILTWKMVIKYAQNIFFGQDIILRDNTFNWMLEFNHDEIFTFCKDFIYDREKEILKAEQAIQEMRNRKSNNEPA